MKMDPGSANKHGPAQRDDEVFDIVNARDEVIGQATRKEAHARGLWHRAVHVLVFSGDEVGGGDGGKSGEEGRVFLQKRSMAKDTAPGCWDSSCSGHVDAGEDYAVAAVRELREEIGLVVDGPAALTPVLRLEPCADTGWEFVWIYRMRSVGPFVINPAEIERGEWWSLVELTRAIAERPAEFSRAFRFLWARLGAG